MQLGQGTLWTDRRGGFRRSNHLPRRGTHPESLRRKNTSEEVKTTSALRKGEKSCKKIGAYTKGEAFTGRPEPGKQENTSCAKKKTTHIAGKKRKKNWACREGGGHHMARKRTLYREE